MHGIGLKLSRYVPLMSFNKLKAGIFEKKIGFYGQKCTCILLILAIFGFAHKNRKKYFFKNP